MRCRTLTGSLGGLVALTMLLAFSLPGPAQADRGDSRSAAAGRAALAQAQAVLSGHAAGDASMALRDLFRTADALSGADLTRARTLLSRPTSDPSDYSDPVHYEPGIPVNRECGTYVCVHWVESGESAATPAFAAEALQIVEGIHERYLAAGYRGPVPDQGQGGDTKTDIYLADVGAVGAYGYCTTDINSEGMPDWVDGWTIAPYCVFDNDFAEFPWHSPEENLEVTAAHEYFHAVQYAYDANDDVWLYETTATWIEDEMYTDVNDNLQYLPYGQMGDPSASGFLPSEGTMVPLDYVFPDYPYPYGNWTFFRYLTEKYPAAQAGLPTLVRDLWEDLDTTGGAADNYSLRALDSTLAQLHTSTAQEYADFSSANRTPAQSYEEGASYPTPALAFGPVTLSRTEPTASQTLTLDHLTSGTGAFVPSDKGSALRVQVDMSPAQTGAAAIVLIVANRGPDRRVPVTLGTSGTGQILVPFSQGQVDRVEVTLVNGSSAMKDCYTDPTFQFSCAGFGAQDGLSATVRVQVVG